MSPTPAWRSSLTGLVVRPNPLILVQAHYFTQEGSKNLDLRVRISAHENSFHA